MRGRTVVVTGAAGFIGSHLVEKLLEAESNVRAFIRYNSANNRGFIDSIPAQQRHEIDIVKGDLRDEHAVRRAVKGADFVFHLGASIAIPYSYQCPTDVIQTNVLGTLHVAQAALDFDSRFIHTSTSETYGTARYVPMNESHPLQAQSPYAASKIAADKIIESFYSSYNFPAVTIRPFNAYGPRQSMRAVIPTIINQALHESEIVLGNLNATRDFTFVEDTAEAFMLAAGADGRFGQTYNAGSGFEISIGDLALKIRELIGRDIPIRIADDRLRPVKSEVDRLFSDSGKAAQELGWTPSVPLETGLKRTIEWASQNKRLYRTDEYVV